MDIKDIIDAVSKIAGVLGLFVAIFVAWYGIKKNRQERNIELQRNREQKERELEELRLTRETNEALFWLELRKMFSEHNEVHLNLRPNGKWYQSNSEPSAKELPKVEAYMGLFEHCKEMLEKGLIDWNTFKNIYAYRVENILRNPAIVRKKIIKRFWGWKDYIQLAKELGYQHVIIETGRDWLISKEGESWLNKIEGKDWLATEEGKCWLTRDLEKNNLPTKGRNQKKEYN